MGLVKTLKFFNGRDSRNLFHYFLFVFKTFIFHILHILVYNNSIICQNLIPNPGFEEHKPFEAYVKPHTYNFHYLKNWDITGLESVNYCNEEIERNKVSQFESCANSISPHTGNGMVRMSYIEACPNYPEITGCASYLQTRLSSPLIVGNVYELSGWVYFPATHNIDNGILQNIGIYLSLYPEKINYHQLLATDYFFGDTITFDHWIEIKHYIRALCPLEYVTIGAFKNSNFPTTHRRIENNIAYYFDDISIMEVPEKNVDSLLEVTPFCNYYIKRKAQKQKTDVREYCIYFDSNQSDLEYQEWQVLDSILRLGIIHTSSVILLSGHTDTTGTENVTLSEHRVASVKHYLMSNSHLKDINFICFSKGSSMPRANNSTSRGRSLNRRVEIAITDLDPSAVLYRKGLEFLYKEDIANALREFRKWISATPMDQKMSILHDPRTKSLKNYSAWKLLVKEVRDAYTIYPKASNAFYLDSLYYADQLFRTYSPYSVTGYFPGLDTFHIQELNIHLDQLAYYDSVNMVGLMEYFEKNSFPSISEVGRRAVRGVCYMIIHSEDSTLLHKYLDVMKSNCLKGEAEWDVYAMMADKLLWCKGLPQIYGTQFVYVNDDRNKLMLYKVDHIDLVNERRIRIGLTPIRNHKEIITVKNTSS